MGEECSKQLPSDSHAAPKSLRMAYGGGEGLWNEKRSYLVSNSFFR